MSASTTLFTRIMRLWCIALALALMVPVSSGFVTQAHAQQAGERQSGGGILRYLFQRREPQRQERVAPQTQRPRQAAPVRRAQPRAAAPAAATAPAVEKAENAKRVLVVGDFMASGLSEGLSAAFAENANVVVVDRSNGSSGLVRDDHYNWPANLADVIEAEKPTVVVVMIGSNDRQQMLVGGTRESVRSEAWTAEYERRATALAKAAREKSVPLVWVGNLPFRPGAMSSDMIAFNDLYRRIATEVEGDYVDVWGGFVDESGAFVANGPDMNGQPAQLRASDGINVTRQGRRKIAFYVEKPLARFLDMGGEAIGAGGLEADGMGEDAVPGAEPAVIDRTSPMAIDDLGAGNGLGLLGAVVRPASAEQDPATERATRDNRPGRADDFMRRKPVPTSPETTTSVTP